VRDALADSGLFDRRNGITAGDDNDRPAVGRGARDGFGAVAEFFVLEKPHRAVPEDHLGFLDLAAKQLDCFRPDVEPHEIRRDVLADGDRSFIPPLGGEVVHGKQQRDVRLFRLRD
jgi:hypothetical protein